MERRDGGAPVPPSHQPAAVSPSVSPASLAASPAPTGRGVVFSRNRYGQVTMTSQPTNESELQLYRVLQHANLLSYYDIFISQGGDDVQQLCEAGEEEFLEIMALVGMASKPLHVRRLQKALQEWVSSPRRFQLPILPVPVPLVPTAGFLPARPGGMGVAREGPASAPPAARPAAAAASPAPSPAASLGAERDGAPSPSHSQGSGDPPPADDSPYPASGSPQLPTPVLLEAQIQRLARSAERIAKTLPAFEPRAPSTKRKACRELELVMTMSSDDPKRPEKFREFAAIYGRFDCKRKAERPLTLHEVSVNEAAAQICMQVPALLTRRDELFPLARQVVRHSGYQYSKGHSRSQGAQGFSPRDFSGWEETGAAKRARLDSDSHSDDLRDSEWCGRQERLEQIADELRLLRDQAERLQAADSDRSTPAAPLHHQLESLQERQRRLVAEQHSLVGLNKQLFKSSMDFDDDDSQFSMSSVPSPTEPGADGPRTESEPAGGAAGGAAGGGGRRPASPRSDGTGSPPLRAPAAGRLPPLSAAPGLLPSQVIASSTGAIIAVANPALTLPATSQPLALVTHAKLERGSSELTTARVKTEPAVSAGRRRLGDRGVL
ncbi:NGFI-A-binding protein homolog [Amphibalanus amphitrite]|uniref:NGFI-A-binding protein homolog n=1 Tax=Amphibalanus amphitrite TaxID=1232801 RepID=UPI001C90B51D|nr:NGFI-A-binding protein homolog [Amphibalanus amphitrite]